MKKTLLLGAFCFISLLSADSSYDRRRDDIRRQQRQADNRRYQLQQQQRQYDQRQQNIKDQQKAYDQRQQDIKDQQKQQDIKQQQQSTPPAVSTPKTSLEGIPQTQPSQVGTLS